MDRAGGLATGERRQYSPYRTAERKEAAAFAAAPVVGSEGKGREAPPRPELRYCSTLFAPKAPTMRPTTLEVEAPYSE